MNAYPAAPCFGVPIKLFLPLALHSIRGVFGHVINIKINSAECFYLHENSRSRCTFQSRTITPFPLSTLDMFVRWSLHARGSAIVPLRKSNVRIEASWESDARLDKRGNDSRKTKGVTVAAVSGWHPLLVALPTCLRKPVSRAFSFFVCFVRFLNHVFLVAS